MKTITKLSLYLLITAIAFSCSEDDEMNNTGNETSDNTVVRFGVDENISESGGEKEIIIPFDKAAHSSGQIDLKLITEEPILFETIPEIIDGIISLQVNKGDTFATFSIIPVNDEIVSGFHDLIFSINALSENFIKGNDKNLKIAILDDEISGLPRSYIIYNNDGNTSVAYFYNAEKKLARIEKKLQQAWDWTETYQFFYSEDSRLIKMSIIYDKETNSEAQYDLVYYWENGKILKAEMLNKGQIYGYILFEYDANGNIEMELEYRPNSLDEYTLVAKTSYTYYSDNNLKEEKTIGYPEFEAQWSNTYTYENYTDKLNPFPINDIIPGFTVQKNLPGIMKYDAGDGLSIYNYTYEFDEEGKVIKRITPYETAIFNYH